MDEVIVSGIRASMRDSLGIKRESIQVVDAISAEDVGDFPDKNIGEAIQRVPGVQINRVRTAKVAASAFAAPIRR